MFDIREHRDYLANNRKFGVVLIRENIPRIPDYDYIEDRMPRICLPVYPLLTPGVLTQTYIYIYIQGRLKHTMGPGQKKSMGPIIIS